MSESVKMPALGESVTEGTVSSWLKAVGDTVEADEPLLEVATDKVDTEVPSPASGVLLEIRVPEDETVEVGTVLAIIGDPSEAGSAPAPAVPAPQAAPEPPAPAPAPAAEAPTPAAPAPAAEASAPAAAAKPASAKPEVDTTLRGRTEKMSRLRQVIADRMIDSLQTSAQLTTVVEVDVTRVAALRARAKNDFLAKNGTKLTFLPFFVQAATEALKAHPKINASIEGKNVTYHDVEHVGIAVDTPRGLLVPVVKNAGDLNIPGLAKRINDLAARTRDNKVNPDELSGSTFTITNTGSGGALFDTPIINQPEVAILGLGAIQRQPRVIKDADGGEVIAIRSVCYLALSYDHRLVDGADAARYLMTVKKRLEEGDFGGELGL